MTLVCCAGSVQHRSHPARSHKSYGSHPATSSTPFGDHVKTIDISALQDRYHAATGSDLPNAPEYSVNAHFCPRRLSCDLQRDPQESGAAGLTLPNRGTRRTSWLKVILRSNRFLNDGDTLSINPKFVWFSLFYCRISTAPCSGLRAQAMRGLYYQHQTAPLGIIERM